MRSIHCEKVETMINLAKPEIWLVCGSQHLYGPGPLQRSRRMRGKSRARLRLAEASAQDPIQGLADDSERNRASLP